MPVKKSGFLKNCNPGVKSATWIFVLLHPPDCNVQSEARMVFSISIGHPSAGINDVPLFTSVPFVLFSLVITGLNEMFGLMSM